LTGGVACGKTTVARYFQELGARIVDADRIGHELLAPGLPTSQEVLRRFGGDILGPDGRIDRKRLGNRVFADLAQLRLLNAIVHPQLIARLHELAVEQLRLSSQTVAIIDAALIFEWGLDKSLAKVIAAWCRPDQQLERLVAKTGMPRAQAEQRIHAQMPAEEKRRRADYVIDCSGSLEQSRAQVESIYTELRGMVENMSS
jgi:dephospho-CoA kinase